MILATMAIGAAIGAVGGVFAIKDDNISTLGKVLIGAGIGATGGLAGSLVKDMLGNASTTLTENAVKCLPTSADSISFTGGIYAGKTEAEWLASAAKHAGIEASTGVNQSGYVRDCLRNAGKAAKGK